MEIKNKIAIVTGASSGIGLALAKILEKHGAKVVRASRSEGIKTDMRKPADIKNLVKKTLEKFGRIDILINNAGQGIYGPLEKINLEDYKKIMDLNVYGVLIAMQEVIPAMRKQGEGLILNVSSRVSQNYYPWLSAYASTKYALNALSLTARKELEKDNIRVCVFHPRMTATDFGKNAIGARPDWNNRPVAERPVIDTAEAVAEKILEQIKSEEAEMGM